ncbi:MAG TPA: hypothetical protein VGV87_15115 [Blastocatellia bacterium]|jgi:hypothetical protein|nr:hypothetical protein [Blastocatellia bacterium]
MTSKTDEKREFLRHTLATLAYRGGKAIRGVPADFATYRLSDESRSASEILAHIGDLLGWALCLAKGEHTWKESAPLAWEQDVERFHSSLRKLDDYLATGEPLGFQPEKLFQGPIADALTHVGQIAMLRRMAGAPMRGENYFKAKIQAGRVGPDQEAPRLEFG